MSRPRYPRAALPSPYKVEIIADTKSEEGPRLTSFLLTYPRFAHAELMTYRVFSRNAASSRAIPFKKFYQLVAETPALPVFWGLNKAGMAADEELPLTGERPVEGCLQYPREFVQKRWLQARDAVLRIAKELNDLGLVHPEWGGMGLHKQTINRLLEPWMPITVLVSSTDWSNFFFQRDHKATMPELRIIATEMFYQYLEHKPTVRSRGDWHLPFIYSEDQLWLSNNYSSLAYNPNKALRYISVGRCARLSYLTHDGKRDPHQDIALCEKLLGSSQEGMEPGHFSPFEHVAQVKKGHKRYANFQGFKQLRKTLKFEDGRHYLQEHSLTE